MSLRQQWIEAVRNNPIMLKDVLLAGGALGAAYGFNVSGEQLSVAIAFIMAIWSPLVRNQVTTVRKPQAVVEGQVVPLVPAAPDNPI